MLPVQLHPIQAIYAGVLHTKLNMIKVICRHVRSCWEPAHTQLHLIRYLEHPLPAVLSKPGKVILSAFHLEVSNVANMESALVSGTIRKHDDTQFVSVSYLHAKWGKTPWLASNTREEEDTLALEKAGAVP